MSKELRIEWSQPLQTEKGSSARAYVPLRVHDTVLVGQRVYAFIGLGFKSNALHALDYTSGSWERMRTSGDVPMERRDHTVNLVEDSLVLIGGLGDRPLADVHVLDLVMMSWRRIDRVLQRRFGPRTFHSADYWHRKRALLVCGGAQESDPMKSDALMLDCAEGVLSTVFTKGRRPFPRSRHASAILGEKLYVCNGHVHRVGSVTDMFVLDLMLHVPVWSQIRMPIESQRSTLLPVYSKGKLLLLGGVRSGYEMFESGAITCVYDVQMGEWIYPDDGMLRSLDEHVSILGAIPREVSLGNPTAVVTKEQS